MVKKFVFDLSAPQQQAPDGGGDWIGSGGIKTVMAANDSLHAALNACKNQITRHHHERNWDRYKRFTNEYELVFTSSAEFPGVASHKPISRSFFKLWELLHDHGAEMFAGAPTAVRAMFLAEGPGGFMESFAKFRSERGFGDGDELHGITLLSKSRGVPCWKLPGSGRRYVIHRGADGTGDLYNVRNIDHMIEEVGERSCHFVTADGGFDFSGDFNNQEEASMRLVLCEAYCALRLQAPGGCFMLKVYDLHAAATMRILYALRSAYARVRIVKPLTSRPANSEKYVLCTGFAGATTQVEAAMRSAVIATTVCRQTNACVCASLKAAQVMPSAFVGDVVRFNTYYVSRQISYIGRTLSLIEDDGGNQRVARAARMRLQLCKAVRWCHKYGIRASIEALRKYAGAM
jgi:hypothetical protein